MDVTITCERYFPETGEKTKEGTPKRMVIDVRKMRIRGEFIFTTEYEVNYLRRNGERRFYVKSLKPELKSYWATSRMGNEPVKLPKWEKEGNYTREQFVEWLVKRGGTDAMVSQMQTMPPTNLEAA